MVSLWWKRIALLAVGALVVLALYLVVWGRIQAGVSAAVYLDACIKAGFCPSEAAIAAKLNPPKPVEGVVK